MGNDNVSRSPQKADTPIGAKHISWPTIRTQSDLSKAAVAHRTGAPVYELQGKKIGEILNSLGAIDGKTLSAIEEHHGAKKIKGKPIGQLLIVMGIIEAEVLTRALCIQTGVPMVDVLAINIPFDVLDRVNIADAKGKKVVPVGVYNKTLYLAVADPTTFSELNHFVFTSKLKIQLVYSPLHEINTFIEKKWNAGGTEIWAG